MRKYLTERAYPENILFDLLGEDIELVQDNINGLEYAMSTLTEREQMVLKARYVDGYTLDEVGNTIGVTRERVRQLQAKALRKLRHPNKSKYYIKGKSIVEAENTLLEELHEQLKQNVLAEIKLQWEESKKRKQDRVESLMIDNLDLSVRSYNCLYRAGLRNISDIIATPKSNLLKIRNLGINSFFEIEKKLSDKGYYIQDDM